MIDLQALLLELGRRIRSAREATRLNVSELAQESGLSRRYVTELEAGRANPSLEKLALLAAALRLPLRELCDLESQSARRRSSRVALVGLRGAGKTTVGRGLALALEAPFIEIDRRVEELAGMSLGELFDLEGVDTFRALEREALERVLSEANRQVLAASGSVVDAGPTFDRLQESCHTVWLTAAPEEHLERVLSQGDRRPVQGHPRALEELRTLLERRQARYSECHHEVCTSGKSADEVVLEILERLGETLQ